MLKLKLTLCSTALALSGTFGVSWAQEAFPIATNRNHSIDMYSGTALGSARIIGMGGAALATAEGSSGMLANPASPGIRTTTSTDVWDWDWHLDSQSAGFGSDHDNNGISTDTNEFQPNFTVGVVGQYKKWGLGFSISDLTAESRFGEDGTQSLFRSNIVVSKLALAYALRPDIVVGGGIRGVSLEFSQTDGGGTKELLALGGSSFEIGGLWKPKDRDIRIGASLSLPVYSDDNTTENCDPLDCAGYIIPEEVKVPWQMSIGFAKRRAPTPWNRQYDLDWRDEKAFLWAVDMILTGTNERGIGLEAFGLHQLQPSGRKHTLSIRGGVEYDWFPGKFRVRGGSYFEPGRFKDAAGDSIGGRLHLTLGFDWRVWSFSLFNNPYRVRVSVTSDVASHFSNSGLSIGFWH